MDFWMVSTQNFEKQPKKNGQSRSKRDFSVTKLDFVDMEIYLHNMSMKNSMETWPDGLDVGH